MSVILDGEKIPKGWRAAGLAAGIKPSGKPDLALFHSESPATWAGTFTTNKCAAACVVRGREILSSGGQAHGVIVNSGNANAATGDLGAQNDAELARLAAKAIGAEEEAALFLTASTGVIGVQLPMEKVKAGMKPLASGLSAEEGFSQAAVAIMTTDTNPKATTKAIHLSGGTGRLVGVAKGAGMIHPNMATMLAFFFTDLQISQNNLREWWPPIIAETFNSITVDGDTSTNDMALVFANGASGLRPTSENDYSVIRTALEKAATELSEAIVRDQEGGVRVLCRIEVTGAARKEGARAAAETLATSLLFKTALHGADPNWGRIVAALGRSGAKFEIERVSIRLGEHLLFEGGQPKPFDASKASKYLNSAGTVSLKIDLGIGSESAHYLTANLSEEYVTFNSAYTT